MENNSHSEKKVPEEIKKNSDNHDEQILWLDDIMSFVSHKIRPPVSRVLGLSKFINMKTNSEAELKKIILYMKQSVALLDDQTKKLSLIINEKILKLKNKKLPG